MSYLNNYRNNDHFEISGRYFFRHFNTNVHSILEYAMLIWQRFEQYFGKGSNYATYIFKGIY